MLVLFVSHFSNAQTQFIIVDSTMTSDCEFNSFGSINTIYGLSFSGSVVLNSDSSLVRLIYIDKNNDEWLLLESFSLITNNYNITYSKHCDETCYFEANQPGSIVVQIVDASITVDTLFYSTVLMSQARSLQEQAKYNNDLDKVNAVNSFISNNNLRWTADYNDIVGMWYFDKKHLLGDKYNYMGFEYYRNGIFETVFTNPNPVQTSLVPSFDWRNRHGATVEGTPYFDDDYMYHTGWITPVSSQGLCGSCGVFGVVAALEALGNLYFNDTKLDFDLSEQEIISCHWEAGNICQDGISTESVMQYIIQRNIIDELSFPYAALDLNCNDVSHNPTPNYEVKSSYFIPNDPPYTQVDQFIEQLINHGPYVVLIEEVGRDHAVLLIGYEVNTNNNEIFWLLKNSWINWGDHGFGWVSIDVLSTFYPTILQVPVYYYGDDSPQRSCLDEDNDGIYWWGIDENKPLDCDECPDYPDCDDNDPAVGGYDEFYNCECLYTYNYHHESINSNQIWDEPKLRNKDVVIKTGYTLTITDVVQMIATSRIIVEPGATLVIDGGKITNMCNELWGGIEVRGSAYLGQASIGAQGIVQLKNGAIIENAVIGIETVKNTRSQNGLWTTDPSFSGGIINAEENTQFLNCRTAVRFYPYPLDPNLPHDNLSSFLQTEFIVNDAFIPLQGSQDLTDYDLSNKFEKMIYLHGVSGIDFLGCDFLVDIPYNYNTQPELFGYGIYANNSSFLCGSLNNIECQFSYFNYGIYNIASQATEGYTSIRETYFYKNITGVYVCLPYNVSTPIEIVLNSFEIIPKIGVSNSSGIYIDNTTSYIVQQNIFDGDYFTVWDQLPFTYGIVVNNSGERNNKIYNNLINNLNIGIQVQDKNRDLLGDNGLQILCNDFDECKYDNYITCGLPFQSDYGIARYQGNPGINTDDPAGNTFHYATTPVDNDILNHTNDITYYYHYLTGGFSVEPLEYTALKVSPLANIESPYTYSKTESCPSNYPDSYTRSIGYSMEQMILYESDIDSVSDELNQLTDAGDTYALNQEVLSSSSDETMELRAELLDASPYLSDTVLSSAVEKEEVLPNPILTEVLVANPQSAKSDKILQKADEREVLLTQNQYDQVIAGRLIAGAKEKLEAKLTSTNGKREFAFTNLVLALKEDTTTGSRDTLIKLLENEEQLLAKYTLIDEYLFVKDTVKAMAAYNSISSSFDLNNDEYAEWQNYQYWLNYRIVQLQVGNSHMNPDSLQKIALYQTHDNANDNLKALIKNVLTIADTLTYHEPYLSIDTTQKVAKTIFRPIYNENPINQLHIYPNPADNYFIVDFSGIITMDDIITIQVSNMEGKIVNRYNINSNIGIKVVDTRTWIPGFYMISLRTSDNIIMAGRVTILD